MTGCKKGLYKFWFGMFRSRCNELVDRNMSVIHVHNGVTFSKINGKVTIERTEFKR